MKHQILIVKKKKKIHDPSLPSFKNIGTKQLQSNRKLIQIFLFLASLNAELSWKLSNNDSVHEARL